MKHIKELLNIDGNALKLILVEMNNARGDKILGTFDDVASLYDAKAESDSDTKTTIVVTNKDGNWLATLRREECEIPDTFYELLEYQQNAKESMSAQSDVSCFELQVDELADFCKTLISELRMADYSLYVGEIPEELNKAYRLVDKIDNWLVQNGRN
jgi:hypothetical protein